MSYRNNTGWVIRTRWRDLAAQFRAGARQLLSEKGVTLIELVVAIGLATVIASATALTITTIIRFTQPVEVQTIALQQVQNAGSWLTRDINMSIVELRDGNPVLLTLTQPQNETDIITVIYKREATSEGSYRLIREEQETGKSMVIAENVEITIAQQADGSGIPLYTITITSQPQAPQAKEVRRYYQVTPRLPQS